jgi:hypothetical protein
MPSYETYKNTIKIIQNKININKIMGGLFIMKKNQNQIILDEIEINLIKEIIKKYQKNTV